MLPDPQELKDIINQGLYTFKCASRRWRVVRLEHKLERARRKEMDLRIKGWAR